jgi:hypothetical protein
MMIFGLICEDGHQFEGWFQDHGSLLDQMERGLVQCPVCGTTRVTQHLSTGGMLRRGGQGDGHQETQDFLRVLQQFIETRFEDVGPEFAKTALRIHYGVEEERNIRGTSTEEEDRLLREEGVPFLKVPLPVPQKGPGYN